MQGVFARGFASGFAIVGVLMSLSCGKNEAADKAVPPAPPPVPSAGAAASAASAAPVETAAPAAAASAAPVPMPTCPPGLTPNAFPAYCIKLPAGYAVKLSRISPKKGSVAYETGTTTDNLMISYDDSPLPQVARDVEGELKFGGDKLEKRGHMAGRSKWYEGSHADYERIISLVPEAGGLTLKCSFAYQPKKPPSKDAIQACKTLVVP
jgi:hypothetical protein